MSSLIVISVLFLILQCPFSSLSNSQGDALYAFKNRLSDPGNVLQSWDPSLVDPCTWLHVTCDFSSDSVIRLNLGNYNFSGTLGPELGQLSNLQYLELCENNLSGNIPEELGNLQNLVSMDLYNNQLEGNIPKSFGNLKSLKFFDYYNTRLSKPPVDGMTSLNHSGRKVLRITKSPTKRSELKELVPYDSSDSKEVIFT